MLGVFAKASGGSEKPVSMASSLKYLLMCVSCVNSDFTLLIYHVFITRRSLEMQQNEFNFFLFFFLLAGTFRSQSRFTYYSHSPHSHH